MSALRLSLRCDSSRAHPVGLANAVRAQMTWEYLTVWVAPAVAVEAEVYCINMAHIEL